MSCAISLELEPFSGYVAECECGGRCAFGVSVVVTPAMFTGHGCDFFRAEVLRFFGPGGARSLVPRGTPAFVPLVLGPREEPTGL